VWHDLTPLVRLNSLSKFYGKGCERCSELTGPEHETSICPQCGTIVACQGVSLELFPGEVLGIVGESGSGKTTILRCLNFDETPSPGSFLPRSGWSRSRLFRSLGSTQASHSIRAAWDCVPVASPWPESRFQRRCERSGEAARSRPYPVYRTIRDRSLSLLSKVQMPLERVDEIIRAFPEDAAARADCQALAPSPKLLLLDEPTSGLDVSVQASVLDLIASLQRETGISMLVVSHDLGIIRLLTHRTMVMKMGRVVEQGITDQILEDPLHPYTQQLVASAL